MTHRLRGAPAPTTDLDSTSEKRSHEDGDTAERAALTNFTALAAHQILMRTGWIFKTESIVMPAVLDTIAGPGWIRGWLPLLNRFGHSAPPLLLASRVKDAPRKKWILAVASALMAGLFLLLAALFAGGSLLGAWTPLAFLIIYTAFFMCTGVSQLAFGTLQGKLVRTTSRGQLLLVSSAIGAVTAVTCALLWLPGWLQPDRRPRFDLVFGFSGLMFTASAASVLFLIEPPDRRGGAVPGIGQDLRGVWLAWRRDHNFRRLTIVAALFACSMMLFPHYQNLGLRQMELNLSQLVWWVVVQNVGTGLFSIPAGRLADRYGNRRVLLIALLCIVAAPVLAISLAASPARGGSLYPLVFVFVGLTPVVLKTLQNFTLELCPRSDHPRYLSALAVASAVPMLLSPLIGLLIDAVGFAVVFLGMAAVVLVAWLLAFGLQEPREHVNVAVLPEVD